MILGTAARWRSAYRPNHPGPWLPIGGVSLIAAILFPLLIRALLLREGHYTLTDLRSSPICGRYRTRAPLSFEAICPGRGRKDDMDGTHQRGMGKT